MSNISDINVLPGLIVSYLSINSALMIHKQDIEVAFYQFNNKDVTEAIEYLDRQGIINTEYKGKDDWDRPIIEVTLRL